MSTDASGEGYGPGSKLLHWLVFAAMMIQFAVGYAIDVPTTSSTGPLTAGSGARTTTSWSSMPYWASPSPPGHHQTGLAQGHRPPPWAEGLSKFERRLAHRTEQVLYWMMFLLPLTGLALLFLSGEDWELGRREWRAPRELVDDDVLLAAYVTSHLVFFAAFAAHVGLVLKHQLVDRDRLLDRML